MFFYMKVIIFFYEYIFLFLSGFCFCKKVFDIIDKFVVYF